jgi:amidohydrolase
MMDLAPLVQRHLTDAIALRHRLHQVPELGYEEVKTAELIRAELDRLGIDHTDGVDQAPTATVALIGDPSRPCMALRADIDALPIAERTGLPYASQHPGRMHACGHDGHAAILCATAAVLMEVADTLAVCVKLIWQPAEEGGGGGEKLVKAGVLDGRLGPKVHGWPGLKVGMVSTKPGALLAATDTFTCEFRGKGCHAAFPHWGCDPIVTACQAVVDLQQVVSRELDPTEPAVVTVGVIRAGTATNVIPDIARIEGTARTLSESARRTVQRAIGRRVQGIAGANGCTVDFTWHEGYPPTVNDPAMVDWVATAARSALGDAYYLPAARPSMGGEDFAYYLQKIPGCFFLIGVQPDHADAYPSLHSDRFDFTDAAMQTGITMMTQLAAGWPHPR